MCEEQVDGEGPVLTHCFISKFTGVTHEGRVG